MVETTDEWVPLDENGLNKWHGKACVVERTQCQDLRECKCFKICTDHYQSCNMHRFEQFLQAIHYATPFIKSDLDTSHSCVRTIRDNKFTTALAHIENLWFIMVTSWWWVATCIMMLFLVWGNQQVKWDDSIMHVAVMVLSLGHFTYAWFSDFHSASCDMPATCHEPPHAFHA